MNIMKANKSSLFSKFPVPLSQQSPKFIQVKNKPIRHTWQSLCVLFWALLSLLEVSIENFGLEVRHKYQVPLGLKDSIFPPLFSNNW